MSILRLQYSGRITKAEHKEAAGKPICEVSICKKVPAKGQDPERFDWVRITIWQPPEWAAPRLIKGNYISGSGDLTMRPYDKDGVKKYSLEVRCGSYDFEVEELAARESADVIHRAAPAPIRPAMGSAPKNGNDDDEVPF